MEARTEPAHKRARHDDSHDEPNGPQSLNRPISPPRKKQHVSKAYPSPWQLTWIRDLPAELNQDAVTLSDLLGDPLISECWEFNFLHSVQFLMSAFDRDTRHLVDVHIVHGFWKADDPSRTTLTQDAAAFDNVHLHTAYMSEIWGTHHCKMMILFRHDDTAQVIIHTANMIPKDWTNMTNAVWKTGCLPKLDTSKIQHREGDREYQLGSGEKFKVDLLAYLKAYNRQRPVCTPLVEKLAKHDFSSVAAVFIASVPGRHKPADATAQTWGHLALKRCLNTIPTRPGPSQVVVQVSSIATLGAKDDWLKTTLFGSMCGGSTFASLTSRPSFKVVFPCAENVREVLDGYASGTSIHTKVTSNQQIKQLQYLRPMLYHWRNDCKDGHKLSEDCVHHVSGRSDAAPHIKTYIHSHADGTVNWALLTSANVSKQAWGEVMQANGHLKIASWEVGVLVWPGLWEKEAVMVKTFGRDLPDGQLVEEHGQGGKAVVGLRMPYDEPLQQYGANEVPWVTSAEHHEPDRLGNKWVFE